MVTETVFGLNGIGVLTEKAVGNQDLSVLQAIVIVSATAIVTINLLVDFLYPILDPRLRTRRGAQSMTTLETITGLNQPRLADATGNSRFQGSG